MSFVAVVDIAVGYGLGYLASHARGGFTHRDAFICDSLETDFLLMGSSRCVRHYNSQIITDSLGMTCYNSGQMGNGIILNYARVKMLCERRKPNVVVYDVYPRFDLFIGEDNHRYLTWLKQHYDRAGIAEVFERVDQMEKYKMTSQLYRYNSRFLELIADYFRPFSSMRTDGFTPLNGEMDMSKIKQTNGEKKEHIVDPVKIEYINKLIEELQGSKLFFVISPRWYGMDSTDFKPIMDICQERSIPFIDFSNDTKYIHQDKYFKDGNHMNARGADEFTRDLIKWLH